MHSHNRWRIPPGAILQIDGVGQIDDGLVVNVAKGAAGIDASNDAFYGPLSLKGLPSRDPSGIGWAGNEYLSKSEIGD